jgi:hypothetical protein
MTSGKQRAFKVGFGLALLLFAGWIGWLVALAASTTRIVVLSRPQFLVSNFDVVAEVERLKDTAPQVTLHEILWPPSEIPKDPKISVTNLPECEGWTVPGLYLLPLMKSNHAYRVVPTPRSPGFVSGAPRIYPFTPQISKQYKQIRKPGSTGPG